MVLLAVFLKVLNFVVRLKVAVANVLDVAVLEDDLAVFTLQGVAEVAVGLPHDYPHHYFHHRLCRHRHR